mgnify:CR=1 FL=1
MQIDVAITLQHADGRRVERSASGAGPVDAAFKAIEDATGRSGDPIYEFDLALARVRAAVVRQ